MNRTSGRLRRAAAIALSVFLAVAGLTVSHAAPQQSRLEDARGRLMELERDFELVAEQYNAVTERLTALQATIGRTQVEVDELSKRMAAKESAAIEIAVTLYKTGSAGTLDAVLSSESLVEMESRLNMLSASEQAQTSIFEGLKADRAEMRGKLADLEEAHAKAASTRERLAALRDEIDAKVERQRGEIASLQRAIARAERRREAREAAVAAAAAAAAAAQESTAPPPTPTIRSPKATNPNAQIAVDTALAQLGKPYQWGGSGPNSFDCSGLTSFAWARAGVSLPHNSGMQYAATPRVDRSDWQPGDLLFFGSPIHHVAIYIGNGQMVDAPYTGSFVSVKSAYRSDYAGAGRPGV